MWVIGLDLGGTEVKGALVDEIGNVQAISKEPTNISKGKDGILKSSYSVINSLITFAEHSSDRGTIQGIGVGSAGRINPNSGEVVFATDNLPDWAGVNIKELFQSKYGLPVTVDNDVNAALFGEVWMRGITKKEPQVHIIMITLGTGVGGANMINGQLVTGAHFQAGEWGHVILVPGGLSCNCGKRGCVEQYISGTSLVRNVNEKLQRNYSHGKQIFEDFSEGDSELSPLIDEYMDYLAITLENISTAVDPDYILLGGGVLESKEYWWPLLQQKLVNYQTKANVMSASLQNQAGMFGAAKQVIDTVNKSIKG